VMRGRCAPLPSPYPPDLSWSHLKRRNDTGSSRIPSRLAHRARPVRQSRDVTTLSRLLPPSPVQAASSFTRRCDGRAMAVSHLHSGQQRLTAH
jgi:hypothetical protein